LRQLVKPGARLPAADVPEIVRQVIAVRGQRFVGYRSDEMRPQMELPHKGIEHVPGLLRALPKTGQPEILLFRGFRLLDIHREHGPSADRQTLAASHEERAAIGIEEPSGGVEARTIRGFRPLAVHEQDALRQRCLAFPQSSEVVELHRRCRDAVRREPIYLPSDLLANTSNDGQLRLRIAAAELHERYLPQALAGEQVRDDPIRARLLRRRDRRGLCNRHDVARELFVQVRNAREKTQRPFADP
jgi:hypothetical protein